MTYQDTLLHIGGRWSEGSGGGRIPVLNPATEETIGWVAKAEKADLEQAVAAAVKGFQVWRRVSAFERSKVMRKAADIIRERTEDIARAMTTEQGKPLAQARLETLTAADMTEWFAEEGRRVYGRVIPARAEGIYQLSLREPVGPVAAFTPWNFPISQIIKKLAAALAGGCSIIIKAAEETPASAAALVQAFLDAGMPDGVINLVFGAPAEISEYLITHPDIRKVSFTGSTAIGKQLASLAGLHMKRVTMELGGHAPAIVFDDADVDKAVTVLLAAKYRNAGQVCIAPTRFIVQENVYDQFVSTFVDKAEKLKVGNGMDESTEMGPLAHDRRVAAMESLIQDAIAKGAKVRTGGERSGNKGYFFKPTVITDASVETTAMNLEPFGPIALMSRFDGLEDAIGEANRLPYGLAAYAFTRSAKTSIDIANGVESGMISINQNGLALPETPFAGIKDSGYGAEGGSEGIEAYVNTRFVSQSGA
ncbi:MAG: NAD-dependent succinate-semialdehyde dehydrogenase [Rhizobiaceae bacterium]|nr:NAD-dependent succinate-semialdehyde dehydrogenase [Rhizobiaceae bacterium]